jgi:hypothetical protein
MTESITCANCDFLLYWGEAIKDRLFMIWSEEKVLDLYKKKCPSCSAQLSTESVKVKIEE